MSPKQITIAALVLLLSGCVTGGDDPRQGGFFGGVSGLSSGRYEDRVKEREARLEQLRATQRGLDAEKGSLDANRSAALARVDADRNRVAAMQSEIAALEQNTRTLTARQGADQKRVQDLQQRVAELKAGMRNQASSLDALEGSGLGDSDMDLRRKQLEAQRNGLRREYELLMQMQMELAQ
ncbi:MAG TPA: hypothetical protein VJ934_04280 [Desulfomicrobiaceae bacterium]|nr:hypothetical protein [Desulfomicrobiaceae bacterium]